MKNIGIWKDNGSGFEQSTSIIFILALISASIKICCPLLLIVVAHRFIARVIQSLLRAPLQSLNARLYSLSRGAPLNNKEGE